MTLSLGGLNVGAATRAGGRTPIGGHRAGSAQSAEALLNLQAQLKEMSGHLEGLEKERDFYFSKVCFQFYVFYHFLYYCCCACYRSLCEVAFHCHSTTTELVDLTLFFDLAFAGSF